MFWEIHCSLHGDWLIDSFRSNDVSRFGFDGIVKEFYCLNRIPDQLHHNIQFHFLLGILSYSLKQMMTQHNITHWCKVENLNLSIIELEKLRILKICWESEAIWFVYLILDENNFLLFIANRKMTTLMNQGYLFSEQFYIVSISIVHIFNYRHKRK